MIRRKNSPEGGVYVVFSTMASNSGTMLPDDMIIIAKGNSVNNLCDIVKSIINQTKR